MFLNILDGGLLENEKWKNYIKNEQRSDVQYICVQSLMDPIIGIRCFALVGSGSVNYRPDPQPW